GDEYTIAVDKNGKCPRCHHGGEWTHDASMCYPRKTASGDKHSMARGYAESRFGPKTRDQVQHAMGHQMSTADDHLALMENGKEQTTAGQLIIAAYHLGKGDGLDWVLNGTGHTIDEHFDRLTPLLKRAQESVRGPPSKCSRNTRRSTAWA